MAPPARVRAPSANSAQLPVVLCLPAWGDTGRAAASDYCRLPNPKGLGVNGMFRVREVVGTLPPEGDILRSLFVFPHRGSASLLS